MTILHAIIIVNDYFIFNYCGNRFDFNDYYVNVFMINHYDVNVFIINDYRYASDYRYI